MLMTFGVDFTFFSGRVLRANDFARYTYTVALFYFLFYDLFVWVFCYRGGNGYHFQESRGGNDTRLHCLGTVEYLGLFFIAVLPSTCLIFYGLFSLYMEFGDW